MSLFYLYNHYNGYQSIKYCWINFSNFDCPNVGIQNAFEARYAEPFEPNSNEKKYAEAFEANSDEKKKFAEAFEASESQPIKVSGFGGLMSGAYGNEKIIGFMYNNDSNTSCKSYGYTNSKGNICLSDSDIKLLTTRGGNAGGAPDQIGH